MSSTARLAAAAALAFAGASAVNLRLADEIRARPFDVGVVPSGAAARWAALGHRTFLSDLYWLATVQYIGEKQAEARGFEKLLPLAELVTDLDPRHGYAYQTAGIVLSAAGRVEQSNQILEKGVARGPKYWTFPYYLAFNHWFYRGDYETAARWAEVAARTPGASPNISHLAVSLAAKAGTPEQAIEVLEELRRTVTDDAIAERIDEQLKLAVLERDAQALERAAARFEADRGRPISSLNELVWNRYLAAIPEDPFGGTYEWNPQDKKVRSSKNPFRFSPREAAQPTPSFPSDPRAGVQMRQ